MESVWYNNLEEVKKYIRKNKKRPSSESEDTYIKTIGRWILRQNYKNKENALKEEDIRRVEWDKFISSDEFKCYFNSLEDKWYNNLEEVKKYIRINKSRPYKKDKDKNEDKDEDIKFLANWIYTQTKNYKNKKHSLKEGDIRRVDWENFISDDKFKCYFT